MGKFVATGGENSMAIDKGWLGEPGRGAGKRRYRPEGLGRLAIIEASQRVGFALDEIRDLLGSPDQPAHERLRQLAVMKLPELDDTRADVLARRPPGIGKR